MLSSKCAVFHTKKSKFIKKQEASGLLSTLRLKKPLSNISGLDILFQKYKINEVMNSFLLERDKFMPKMNLSQPKFM